MVELSKVSPSKVPRGASRAEMSAILKTAIWGPGDVGLAGKMQEAIAYAAAVDGGEQCPVLDITPSTVRWVKHYGLVHSFSSGMGGMVPPGATVGDSSCRDVHAFNIIRNENERLRKLEKKDPDGTV